MATQRQRLSQQMLNAGNLGFNKPLPVDRTIAGRVAPLRRYSCCECRPTVGNKGTCRHKVGFPRPF